MPIHEKTCGKGKEGNSRGNQREIQQNLPRHVVQTKPIPDQNVRAVQSSRLLNPPKAPGLGTFEKKPSRGQMIPFAESAPPGRDDRVACRKCKRKFNSDRINKHQSVCIGPIKEIIVKPVVKVQKKKKTGAVPIWKKQHLDFINNVRYAKKMQTVQAKGGDIRKIQAPVQHYDISSDYIQCPYCSRKYSQQVAERHIPSCKNIINKPKPPPKQTMKSAAQPVMRSLAQPVMKNTVQPSRVVEKKSGAGPGYCQNCGGKFRPNSKRCGFCG